MKMAIGEGIRSAIRQRMTEDPNVVVFGEDVGLAGGAFNVTHGLMEEFGESRVRDTPISEGAITGMAVGAAIAGLRPIVEIMLADFLTLAMDQLVNQAAKLRYMTGGHVSVPMVVRAPAGGGFSGAAQHSQSLEAWFTHTPGLKVVYPSTSEDARGLLLSAIDDDNPVVFFENKNLYSLKCDVEDVAKPIPLGKAKTVREGSDVTILTYGIQVYGAMKAAEKLAEEGIDAEVIDLRSLFPLDLDLIKASLSKTGRVLLLSEETKRGAYISDIAAILAEECFHQLRAPIVRVASLNSPIPFMKTMEDYYLPSVEDVIQGVKKQLSVSK